MHFLNRHFDQLNERYQGADGDRFAIEELTPVAARFCPPGGRVLEVGCGYGRNLVALARINASLVAGSDPSEGELKRAQSERVAALHDADPPVALVRQEPFRLPFRDGSVDLVVLWQVVEHLFGPTAKPKVLAECLRVLKPGGHLLVETPNQWFPFDYHDNKLPFVHWVLPSAAREWLTWKVRGMRYAPSEYVSLPGLERLLRAAAGGRRVRKATRVYFADHYGEAWRDLGGTQLRLKRLLFILLAPVHLLLSPFGGSADLFLPSLRVVYRIDPPDEET
jgi:SAM-dependent methyltransferase